MPNRLVPYEPNQMPVRLMTAGQLRIAEVLSKCEEEVGMSDWALGHALGYQGSGAQNALRVRQQLKRMSEIGWVTCTHVHKRMHAKMTQDGLKSVGHTRTAYARRAMRRVTSSRVRIEREPTRSLHQRIIREQFEFDNHEALVRKS